jgi:hypothetical protein
MSRQLRTWPLSGGLALGAWMVAAPALAATWTGGRTTPSLLELFAIDKTGEEGWIYGAEDVMGDGLQNFKQQERSIDIRTAYAAADANNLWVRTYVSDTSNAGGNVTIYLFIDRDKSSATGGSAAATNINAQFVEDLSPGGYEYVMELGGNGMPGDLWKWDGSQFATQVFAAGQVVVEASTDRDPIQIGDDIHGYIQGTIALSLVELTPDCNANLYVRSSSGSGKSDLEVGQVGSCNSAGNDANGNGIPDPLENPPNECSSDAQCPGAGLCHEGKCIFPIPCIDSTDCQTGYTCAGDRCVPEGGGSCTTNADCQNGLVCEGSTCVACTPGGTQCGAGRECSPTGVCVDDKLPGTPCTSNDDCDGRICGSNKICRNCTSADCADCGADGRCGAGIHPNDFEKQGGEEVQGGACACSTPGSGATSAWLLLLALPTALGARRLRRRLRSDAPPC